MEQADVLKNLREERDRIWADLKQQLTIAEAREYLTDDDKRFKANSQAKLDEITKKINLIEESNRKADEADQARSKAEFHIRPASVSSAELRLSEQDRDLLDFFRNKN